MFKLLDQQIRRSFSDAAFHYDVLTSLHKEIGRELFAKIREKEIVSSILDVGMGTGWLTNKIAFYFPGTNIVGIDSAKGMVDHARSKYAGIKFLQADAQDLPFQQNTFDIIISNLAYQWVDDLQGGFREISRVLRPKGELYITMFGHQTFSELFLALEQAAGSTGENIPLAIDRLATKEAVGHALKDAGFPETNIDHELIKVRFPDMMGLVKWIKDIGANALKKDLYIGKELLNQAAEYYDKKFCDRLGVYATFEVIWVYARK